MNNFDAMEMTCEGGPVTVRPLANADRAALLAFARGFATHDLLFLRRDVAGWAWLKLDLQRSRVVDLFASATFPEHACLQVQVYRTGREVDEQRTAYGHGTFTRQSICDRSRRRPRRADRCCS